MTDPVSRPSAATTLYSALDADDPTTLTNFAFKLLSARLDLRIKIGCLGSEDFDAKVEDKRVFLRSLAERDTPARHAAIAAFDVWQQEQAEVTAEIEWDVDDDWFI